MLGLKSGADRRRPATCFESNVSANSDNVSNPLLSFLKDCMWKQQISFPLFLSPQKKRERKELAYIQYLQEILDFAAFRVYTRDDPLQVWHAFYELCEILAEGRMINEILDSIKSKQIQIGISYKPNTVEE